MQKDPNNSENSNINKIKTPTLLINKLFFKFFKGNKDIFL